MIPVRHPEIDLARFAQDYGMTFRRIEQAHSDHSLGAGALRLLFGLRDGPVIAAELMQMVGMDSGQATRAIARLIERGLVARDKTGKRRTPLSLSDEGRAAIARCEREREIEARKVYDGMTEPERVRLLQAADSLSEHLNDMQAELEIVAGDIHDTGLLLDKSVRAITNANLQLDPVKVAKELHRRFADMIGSEFIVARLGGDLVGGAFLRFDRKSSEAEIAFLCVYLWYQGRGAGAGLLRACAEKALQNGKRSLRVTLPVVEEASLIKIDPAWQRGRPEPCDWCGGRIEFADWQRGI